MEESQKAFEDASKTLKMEVTRFEVSALQRQSQYQSCTSVLY